MGDVIALPPQGPSPAQRFVESQVVGVFYFTAQHGVDAAAAEAGVQSPVIEGLSRLVYCTVILQGELVFSGGSVCGDGDQDAAAQRARESAMASAVRYMSGSPS